MYEGILNVKELIDWISAIEKYFEYMNVDNDKQVNYIETRLKCHASLWSDGVQVQRGNKGHPKIKR